MVGFLQTQFLPVYSGKDGAALQVRSQHSCWSMLPSLCSSKPCPGFSQRALAMPPLPHSLEYYAMLWQEACARGHGSSSASPAEDTSTAPDSVQQGVLLASGRARPPTPPKPKTHTCRGLPSEAAHEDQADDKTSHEVQQGRAGLEEEGHQGLSRVHFVTLSRQFGAFGHGSFSESQGALTHLDYSLQHKKES